MRARTRLFRLGAAATVDLLRRPVGHYAFTGLAAHVGYCLRGRACRSFLDDLSRLTASAPPKQLRILELGCGDGRMARALSDVFGEVHAVDISPEMIKKADRFLRGRSNGWAPFAVHPCPLSCCGLTGTGPQSFRTYEVSRKH